MEEQQEILTEMATTMAGLFWRIDVPFEPGTFISTTESIVGRGF